jgi:hypothetical protein
MEELEISNFRHSNVKHLSSCCDSTAKVLTARLPEWVSFFIFFSFFLNLHAFWLGVSFHWVAPHSRYVRIACEHAFDVNTTFISRIFKSWRWSFKSASPEQQLLKYTQANIEYYIEFVNSIQSIPWRNLKFLDESHFKSKGRLYFFFFQNQNDQK